LAKRTSWPPPAAGIPHPGILTPPYPTFSSRLAMSLASSRFS
jgi:hypothetical protein